MAAKGGKAKKGPFEAFDLKIRGSILKYDGDAALSQGYESQVLPGTFGMKDKPGKSVAIKYTRTSSKDAASKMKKDVRNLTAIDHKNLVRYYDCTVVDVGGEGTDFAVITVMERMQCSLLDLFFNNAKFANNVTFEGLVHIFMGVAKGLEYLHQERIVHYDLKTASILASKNGKEVKIGDYAGCKILSPERGSVTVASKLNMKYKAPEVTLAAGIYPADDLDNELRVTQEIDIYSLGCVMWECLNFSRLGDKPVEPYNSGKKIYFQGIGGASEIHCNGPDPLCRLIQDCLKFSKNGIDIRTHGRPTASKITERLEEMLHENWIDYKIKTYVKGMEKNADDWFGRTMDWATGKRK